jgi:hypothetical protein
MVRAGGSSDLSLNTPIYADDQSPPQKPLMSVLNKAGAGNALSSSGINVQGFVEGSWTYNFGTPNNQLNVGRVFDYEDQDLTLNQVDLQVSRVVDATKGHFDVGFMFEGMWGGDARLIHSNGWNFYGPINANNVNLNPLPAPGEKAVPNKRFAVVQDGPDEQFDIVQANFQLAIPVGTGLTVTAGKFVTLAGYETINPTTNPFYSHSFMFGYAIPLTQTGVMGKYNITKSMALTLGISRGWEQTAKDNNGAIDGFGQLSWAVNDKTNVIVTILSGPQQDNNTGNYRTVVDVVANYKLGDNTSIGFNADYGYGSREGNDIGGDGKPGSADWWGAALYLSQKIDSHFTANARAEYFNDDDGARGLDTGLVGVTLGVTITPFPDNQWASGLMFRPEVRWDHASNDVFNDRNDQNQFTVAGDLIYAF